MLLLLIQFLSSLAQTLGAQLQKKHKAKNYLIFGGLVLAMLLQVLVYREGVRKDSKLEYQEAILKKVSDAELSRASLAVKMEENKLTILDGMRSELIERIRNEDSPSAPLDASPSAEGKP
jgi:hypothetical protein